MEYANLFNYLCNFYGFFYNQINFAIHTHVEYLSREIKLQLKILLREYIIIFVKREGERKILLHLNMRGL